MGHATWSFGTRVFKGYEMKGKYTHVPYRIRHLEWWWYDMVWYGMIVQVCDVMWCDVMWCMQASKTTGQPPRSLPCISSCPWNYLQLQWSSWILVNCQWDSLFSKPGGTQEDLEENASEGFGPVCFARSLGMFQGEGSGTELGGLRRPDR